MKLGVLLRADRRGECPLLVTGITRDSLLGSVAAKHAQGHDGDHDEQQHGGDQHHAALTMRLRVAWRVHEFTPAAFMVAMTRRIVMVGGFCGGIGLVNVIATLTEQTLVQSVASIWLAFKYVSAQLPVSFGLRLTP